VHKICLNLRINRESKIKMSRKGCENHMGVLWEKGSLLSVEELMQHELDKIVTKYDNRLISSLIKKEYDSCEQYFTDFCFALLDLEEDK